MASQKIFKLQGKIKNYDWGGTGFLSLLLGLKNPANEPLAEYWMGAHPLSSSELISGKDKISLYEKIQQAPKEMIGDQHAKNFGKLPFLFKILDVEKMLSIQVHPEKQAAAEAFEAENKKGIPPGSPQRNYKDDNHKPEIAVALSDFWLLHGFKPKEQLRQMLQVNGELNFLIPVFNESGYEGIYRKVMMMPQQEVNSHLEPLVSRAALEKNDSKSQPGFWINKYQQFNKSADLDRGLFSIFFFNIVHLQPGQGIFQAAGLPHAYLQGQCVELMANSDNVLRGGLTSKHIDVPELLKHIKFEETVPVILNGENRGGGEKFYDAPVDDFALSAIELNSEFAYMNESSSAEICIVTDGLVKIPEANLEISRGEAFYIMADTPYSLIADEKTVLFKAFIPVNN